jgi:hypothetical protein
MKNDNRTTLFGGIAALGTILSLIAQMTGGPAWLLTLAGLLTAIGSGGTGYFAAGVKREDPQIQAPETPVKT